MKVKTASLIPLKMDVLILFKVMFILMVLTIGISKVTSVTQLSKSISTGLYKANNQKTIKSNENK
jgi:hypothetical protein